MFAFLDLSRISKSLKTKVIVSYPEDCGEELELPCVINEGPPLI